VLRNRSCISFAFGKMGTLHEAVRMGNLQRRKIVQNSSAIVDLSGNRLYGRRFEVTFRS